MAKPTPTPPTPPSTPAARLIRSVRQFTERPVSTRDEYAQKVIDLQHLYVAVRELLDPAYYEAISSRGGGVSYRDMVRRTGLSKSAIQRRVDRGAALPALSLRPTGEEQSGAGA